MLNQVFSTLVNGVMSLANTRVPGFTFSILDLYVGIFVISIFLIILRSFLGGNKDK